ncbi:MAG: DNA gyrase subunit A [Bacteroidetes bacterium]|nr:DNA gyrase subunit A [Bacteroidota bacterium]MCY4205120.1 DNA gyrase subunit A [Bacteroidota bacterium]
MADIIDRIEGDDQERIVPLNITEEMESSYIDYSMSVIVGRALPDVRDGLKPAHRRVLFGMSELGLTPGSTYKKSARIVGEVLGKYHPHGDSSVYDTMVRMAQYFSLRCPLVDGQGNFGSVDGDSAAAMRYTEARLTRLAAELLRDIKQDTVDFQENFDGSLEEPVVLPAAAPNLLINGGDGIAVGMATKIPPHNLREVASAIIAYIDNPLIDTIGLMEHVPGPDFPTGGIIYGVKGVQAAYHTGRGRILMRAKIHEEELQRGRIALIITEIPYQVNKAVLVEKIAELVRDKRIEGISDLRDESDRDGMRIVVELKKDAHPQVIENKLYKYSRCQQSFGANLVALVNGRPEILTLKDAIVHFVNHRYEVVTRRTQYQLNEVQKQAHILEGLVIALDYLDAVITMIRESPDIDEARECLVKGIWPSKLTPAQLERLGLPETAPGLMDHDRDTWLSEAQANAILALRLSRLTGLERDKILEDFQAKKEEVVRLTEILGSKELRMNIIKEEITELADKYGDDRRTEIDDVGGDDILIEDLIDNTRMVVTVSHQGVIKRTPLDDFQLQGRGGIGARGSTLRSEDYLEHLFASYNLDYLLIFTDHGQCYFLRVYQIPVGARTSQGRSIRNLISIASDDRIRAVLPISREDFTNEEFLKNHYVLMATRGGLLKKTALWEYRNPWKKGLRAIKIREGDSVLEARLTDGNSHIILASSGGLANRRAEKRIRAVGRFSQGVIGIRMKEDQQVVGMVVVSEEAEQTLLTVSANGFGKRSKISDYRETVTAGQGVTTQKINEKTGALVAIRGVLDSDDLMIITQNGTLIRQAVSKISVIGRASQGVRLIRLRENDFIADVTRVISDDQETDEEDLSVEFES